MSDKRGLYIVVLIDDGDNKTKKQSKTMTTQMLFMLTAKSGDERTKWLHHLQAVLGNKTSNMPCVDIDLAKNSSSTSSLQSLKHVVSAPVTMTTTSTNITSAIDSPTITNNNEASALTNANSVKLAMSNSSSDDEAILRGMLINT